LLNKAVTAYNIIPPVSSAPPNPSPTSPTHRKREREREELKIKAHMKIIDEQTHKKKGT
jgi:hypothetical protein